MSSHFIQKITTGSISDIANILYFHWNELPSVTKIDKNLIIKEFKDDFKTFKSSKGPVYKLVVFLDMNIENAGSSLDDSFGLWKNNGRKKYDIKVTKEKVTKDVKLQRTYYILPNNSLEKIEYGLLGSKGVILVYIFSDIELVKNAKVQLHQNKNDINSNIIHILSPELKEKIQQLSKENKSAERIYREILAMKDISQVPTMKQIQNYLYKYNPKSFQVEELLDFMNEESIQFVESILIRSKSFQATLISKDMKRYLIKYSEVLPTYFQYDCTFNIGKFYVSILINRCTLFKELPTIPIAFLLHTSKELVSHSYFFHELKANDLNIDTLGTDFEQSIYKGYSEVFYNGDLLFCIRHFLEDLTRKLNDLQVPETKQKQIKVLFLGEDDVQGLFDHEEKDFDTALSIFYQTTVNLIGATKGKVLNNWVESNKDLIRFMLKTNREKNKIQGHFINNASESMNRTVKAFILEGDKELSLSEVAQKLYLFQESFLIEISNGTFKKGRYSLQDHLKQISRFRYTVKDDPINLIEDSTDEENPVLTKFHEKQKTKKVEEVEESKANDEPIDEEHDKEPINEDHVDENPIDENPVDEDGLVVVEDVTELSINLKDITSLNSSSCLKIQQQALKIINGKRKFTNLKNGSISTYMINNVEKKPPMIVTFSKSSIACSCKKFQCFGICAETVAISELEGSYDQLKLKTKKSTGVFKKIAIPKRVQGVLLGKKISHKSRFRLGKRKPTNSPFTPPPKKKSFLEIANEEVISPKLTNQSQDIPSSDLIPPIIPRNTTKVISRKERKKENALKKKKSK